MSCRYPQKIIYIKNGKNRYDRVSQIRALYEVYCYKNIKKINTNWIKGIPLIVVGTSTYPNVRNSCMICLYPYYQNTLQVLILMLLKIWANPISLSPTLTDISRVSSGLLYVSLPGETSAMGHTTWTAECEYCIGNTTSWGHHTWLWILGCQQRLDHSITWLHYQGFRKNHIWNMILVEYLVSRALWNK